MTTGNTHVEEFLAYYLDLPTAPEYAVLLKGRWGTGKTWFIRRVIDRIERDNRSVLYVSLYGISSFDALEHEFFRQLHPVLSSKGMSLVGKLAKGLLKGALKVDLDSSGGAKGEIDISIPSIELPKYLANTQGFVLVFDDLERCSIKISDLLGYINHFVEQDGYKAILIGNEDEILEREEKQLEGDRPYKRIKEKLIGKTFEIEPDFAAAIKAFQLETVSGVARKAFEDNLDLIQTIYLESKYGNLRHLRQALRDLERLIHSLHPKAQGNPELVSRMIRLFLIFSFEIKSGEMKPREIAEIKRSFYARMKLEQKTSDPNNLYNRLAEKYVGSELINTLLDPKQWQQILENGVVDAASINETLFNSRYLASSESADWVQLWHVSDLEDGDVSRLLPRVLVEWNKGGFDSAELVLHVTGILLWLSEIGVYELTKLEIVQTAKGQIDELKKKKKLIQEEKFLPDSLRQQSAFGLGYHSVEMPEFKEILKYLIQKSEEMVVEGYPREAINLLGFMAVNTDKFCRMLMLCDHEDQRYYDIPILKYIDLDAFVNAFLVLRPYQRRSVTSTIEERYKYHNFKGSLAPDRSWLIAIAERLAVEATKRPKTISGYYLGTASKVFHKAAESLVDLPLLGLSSTPSSLPTDSDFSEHPTNVRTKLRRSGEENERSKAERRKPRGRDSSS